MPISEWKLSKSYPARCWNAYGNTASTRRLSSFRPPSRRTIRPGQKFREYLRDLSVQREQECKIADEEAQRCRGIISKEPPSSTGTRRSR